MKNLIAVTFDSQELVEQFLESNAFAYQIAPAANDAISIYGVQSFPTNMVINQQGQIVFRKIDLLWNLTASIMYFLHLAWSVPTDMVANTCPNSRII